MLIRHADGTTQVGILLALTGDRLRVAIRDEDDVVEYRLVSGRWVSEDCEPVTFQFPLAAFEAAGIMPQADEPELPASSVGPAVTRRSSHILN
jgi:hypothetical protein